MSSQGRLSLCNTLAYFINTAYLILQAAASIPRLVHRFREGPAWIGPGRYTNTIAASGMVARNHIVPSS